MKWCWFAQTGVFGLELRSFDVLLKGINTVMKMRLTRRKAHRFGCHNSTHGVNIYTIIILNLGKF